MYTIETIDSFEGFAALEPVWNDFLAASDVDVPFLSFEWISCWWQSYGGGKEMLLFLVKEDGKLAAIAPLMRFRTFWRRFPVTAITFIANEHSLRLGIIMKGRSFPAVRALIHYIREGYPHDLLFLDMIEKESPTEKGVGEISAAGVKCIALQGYRSPYIPVSGDWDAYLKGRSKNFRHKLNRIANLYGRRGDYGIRRYTDRDIDEALGAMLTISRKSWKFTTSTAIVSNENDTRFYRLLATAAAKKGWLNVWVLRAGGQPAAFAYNLDYGGKIYALKIGFDEELGSLSPSEFLNTYAIRDCFEKKRREYDWLGKDLPFKMRWTSSCREHRKYLLFSGRPYGQALYFLESGIVPKMKKLLSRSPGAAGQLQDIPGSAG